MKNRVECYKDFFPYFKALKTNCDLTFMALPSTTFPYGQPITTHSLAELHCDWLNIWISDATVLRKKNVNGLDLTQDVVSA